MSFVLSEGSPGVIHESCKLKSCFAHVLYRSVQVSEPAEPSDSAFSRKLDWESTTTYVHATLNH